MQPSKMSQCIDGGGGEAEDAAPLNVTEDADTGQLCVGTFCWYNEAKEAISNVMRAYADPTISIRSVHCASSLILPGGALAFLSDSAYFIFAESCTDTSLLVQTFLTRSLMNVLRVYTDH